MDPSAVSRVLAPMTLARTRLSLGITAVGATVLLAVAALWLDLAGAWLPNDSAAPLHEVIAKALLWPLAWTLLLLPLDVIGGTVAVRQRPEPTAWLRAWLRGVATQVVVLATAGAVLVLLSRSLGLFGAVVGTTLAAIAIASQTGALVRLGASTAAVLTDTMPLRAAGLSDTPVRVVETGDEAFVGGFTGVIRPQLVVPASWFALPSGTLHGLLVRRRLAIGAPRVRGLAVAMLWLALGATVSGVLIGIPDSSSGLVRFSLGTTLWSFLGVLVLPTPSRRAVVTLDQQAARVVGADAVREGMLVLDRWQDDEPARAPVVETVFHPVPGRAAREAALAGAPPRAGGAWRVARLALPLGLGGWSLLGRAVHCNLGRPALWWMLPGD
jgi:hypothetical protein